MVITPTPPPTEHVLGLLVVHAPPVSALPHPLLTVLVKVSAAYTVAVPADTVTDWLAVAVAPALSVTVSVTV
jgi:hypothetical protein